MSQCDLGMKGPADLEITDDQNSQSNPNVVVGKHGHLTLNIHPAKEEVAISQWRPLLPAGRAAADSPAVHRVVVVVPVFTVVPPRDGVVDARLVLVLQQLDFHLVAHKRVSHHAVHEEHEGLSGAMDQGAQPADDHQHLVPPGGEPVL